MKRKRICFVTPSHLASNPRLVKEATAASEAGYDVSVVFTQHLPSLVPADQSLLDIHLDWDLRRIDWAGLEWHGKWLRLASGIRQRVARRAFAAGVEGAAVQAESRLMGPMLRATRTVPADLFIAHNLAALPVAVKAAQHRSVLAGFDAEDYHVGQLPDTPDYATERRQTETVERTWMPRCAYISAASDGIADAYASRLGIVSPTVVHNVFPLAERDAYVPEEELGFERAAGTETLYWFSQTIGPDRGLEDAVDALPMLDNHVHLALRGYWAGGYQDALMARAMALGVGHRVRSLPPCAPIELVVRTAHHSIGLALEQPETFNRRICVTNKLFTYWLAGLPTVATNTEGQYAICTTEPKAAELVPPGNPVALADAVRTLLADLPRCRAAAHAAADSRWNWDVEKNRLLGLWERVLHQTAS